MSATRPTRLIGAWFGSSVFPASWSAYSGTGPGLLDDTAHLIIAMITIATVVVFEQPTCHRVLSCTMWVHNGVYINVCTVTSSAPHAQTRTTFGHAVLHPHG